MSAGGAFGGNRGARPVPPEKGVFPLDHMHLCDLEKKEYINCLKSSGHKSEKCRHLSKMYLHCRMEKNLMAKQDMSELGFGRKNDAEALQDGSKMGYDLDLDRFGKSTRSRFLAMFNPNTLNIRDQEKKHGPAKPDFSQGFQFSSGRSTPRAAATKWMPPGALSSMESAAESNQISCDDDSFVSIARSHKMEFNRVNYLVWAMHESARGFSLAAQALDLARTGPELAMAWRGVDAHAWHKNIAYQVAVCGLLKAAIEVEIFLCRKQSSNLSPAHEILSPKAHLLAEQIERELNARNPKLVLWFRSVELPRIAGLFIPLFKKWSLEYAGSLQKLKIIYDKSKNFSGVAGKILALSCCTAIMKLESQRISHPSSFIFIEDASIKLMTLSEGLVSVNKLHHLASEAGFEEDFLSHFGRRILPSNNMEDLEFWIGLVQRKLSAAFQRESVITGKHKFHDKAQENSLAFLGLFAYLGRETRLYLSRMGIKDLDEHSKNFLSYLECGSLLIHPDLSTMSKYHLFMEVVTDEIGWLHFYPEISLEWCQDRRRSKRQVRHAEKEIVLCKVLKACYDVISGFAHYSNSTQQAMNSNLLEFLFNSQNLLSTCMDDYWAAFDKKSTEPQKLIERSMSNSASSSRAEHMPKISTVRGMDPGCRGNQTVGSAGENEVTIEEWGCTSPVRPLNENFLVKASRKVISTSVNAWMGTQLLFIDALEVIGMVRKQLHGCGVTKREKKKIKRTLVDFASLVPVLILMLLPVSPVGHAAILAAIKKYLPCLIPSPYTSERIGLVKQLKRIKKIEFPGNSNIQDAPEVIDPFNT